MVHTQFITNTSVCGPNRDTGLQWLRWSSENVTCVDLRLSHVEARGRSGSSCDSKVTLSWWTTCTNNNTQTLISETRAQCTSGCSYNICFARYGNKSQQNERAACCYSVHYTVKLFDKVQLGNNMDIRLIFSKGKGVLATKNIRFKKNKKSWANGNQVTTCVLSVTGWEQNNSEWIDI